MEIFIDGLLLIILIAPGFAASFIHEWLKPINCSLKRFITRAVVYTGLISILMFLLYVLRGHADYSLSTLFTTIQNVLKYGIVSFILSLIVPSFFIILQTLLEKIIKK